MVRCMMSQLINFAFIVHILFSIQTLRCTHSSCITPDCLTLITPSRTPKKKQRNVSLLKKNPHQENRLKQSPVEIHGGLPMRKE